MMMDKNGAVAPPWTAPVLMAKALLNSFSRWNWLEVFIHIATAALLFHSYLVFFMEQFCQQSQRLC